LFGVCPPLRVRQTFVYSTNSNWRRRAAMMKRTFKVGDKVFAKVKGYPAWPAKITSAGKRYEVTFYGTGEVGTVKPEDLFYFLRHKPQLLKNHKRKFYAEAVREIEADIAAAGGTDGDGVYSEGTDGKDDKKNTINENKRKATDYVDEDVEIIKKLKASDEEEETVLNETTVIEPEETPKDGLLIVSDNFLIALQLYAKKIGEKPAFKTLEPDPVSLEDDTRVKHILVKHNSKLIALKFETKELSEYSSELERAEDEAKLATDLLQLKKDIESGKLDPGESSVKDKVVALPEDANEDELSAAANDLIVDCKKKKLKYLKRDADIVECILNIKRALGLDKADPMEAVRHMKKFQAFKLDPFTLKKHTLILDAFKRLQRYIGNIKFWALGDDEVAKFKEQAQVVRELATTIYNDLKNLFPYGNNANFSDKYKNELKKFTDEMKDMSESQQKFLIAEPLSRKAVLDEVLENFDSYADVN